MSIFYKLLILCLIILFPSFLLADDKDQETFKIVYAESWAPISVGSVDNVTGILPSLMEVIIHDKMGIVVEHQGLPWARAQQAVKTGKADAFITTATQERLAFARPSKGVVFPLRFQPIVRVGSDEETLFHSEEDITKRLSSKRYCDVLGNGWAKHFYARKNITYQVVPTLDICLKHLIHGQTDIIIHAVPVASNFISKLKLSHKVKILPIIMASSPQFPLLVSKSSTFGQNFLEEFDEALTQIKRDGIWESLLISSLSSSN